MPNVLCPSHFSRSKPAIKTSNAHLIQKENNFTSTILSSCRGDNMLFILAFFKNKGNLA